MATIKDYLQLFRCHTAPLEITIAVLGAAIGTNTLFTPKILLFAVFGFLYHIVGYGHNSVMDFIKGFDRDDPNKSHHPLQRGAIDVKTAKHIIYILLGASFVYGIILSIENPVGIGILVFMLIMGLIYNLIGKRIKAKFIPIAFAHSSIFPYAYFASGGSTNILYGTGFVMLLATIYFFVQIMYQILIEGDLKDLGRNEATMLDILGIKLENNRIIVPFNARILGFLLKMANIGIGFYIIHMLGGDIKSVILGLIFAIFIIYYDHKLLSTRIFDHRQCLRDMAFMEVICVFFMVIVFIPIYSPSITYAYGGATTIILIDLLYFVLMNRYLWGTMVMPRV